MLQIILMFLCFFSSSILLPSVGNLDTSFGTSGTVTTSIQTTTLNAQRSDCAVQQDGKIVVVGNANPGFAVARYTQQGVLDTTFNTTGTVVTTTIGSSALANGVVIDNEGRIVVCGVAGGKFAVARYLSNGALDVADFNSGGSVPGTITTTVTGSSASVAYGLAIDNNGYIVVCGGATISGGSYVALARYTSAGILDNSFGSSGLVTSQYFALDSTAYGITFDSNNKILICGYSNPRCVVARYTSSGVLDTTSGFGPNSGQGFIRPTPLGSDPTTAYGIALDSNNKIVICGSTTVSGSNRLFVARILSDGSDLDSTFNSSSGYVTLAVGTNSTGYGTAIDFDGNILVGGSNNGRVLVARYTSVGVLDTTFNPSTGYNDVVTSTSAPGVGFILQQNNELVAACTTSGSFKVSQYIGNAAPQGCMDTTYNSAGATPGYITDPTDTTSSHKPIVKALQILSTNSVFVLTENLAAPTKSQLVQIDSAGSTTSANAIAAIDIAQIGGADVISDSRGRALVVGGNGSNGWIARYVPTSGTPGSFALDSTFNGGAIKVQSSSPTTTAYSRVCEQASGNILVMGQNGTTGIVVAYNQDGTINTNFATSGVYSFATTTLDDMFVDSSDNIYVTARITSGNITFYCIQPNGGGLKSSFNSGAGVNTGLASASYQGAKVAPFSGGSLTTLITVNTSTDDIIAKRYTTSGGLDATTTIAQTTTLLSNPIITQFQIDSNSAKLFVGYDDDCFFVGQFSNSLNGTTFAPYSSCPGILKTMYNNNNPSRVGNCIGIAPSGSIVFGGYENIDGSNTIATIGQVVGGASVSERVRYPGAKIGQIDTNFGTSGFVQLASLSGGGALAGLTPQVVLPTSSGQYYIAFTSGALIRLTSTAILDTTFAPLGTGFASSSTAGLYSMFMDGSGRLVVAGTNGGAAWVKRYNAGLSSLDTTFNSNAATALTGATLGTVAIQQTLGRYIVAGSNGTNGALYALTNTGTLDTTFNSQGAIPGMFDTGVANGVYALISDEYDRLIIAYLNIDRVDIVRLTSAGQVDTTFGSSGTITAAISSISNPDSATQIRLTFDISGNIVLAAHVSTSGGEVLVKAYENGSGTVLAESRLNITSLTSPTFTSLIATADNKVLLGGYQSGANDMWVARVEDDGSGTYQLDSDFGTSGLMEFARDGAGTVTGRNLASIALYPNGEIALVGTETNSANSPTISPFLSMAYDNPGTTQIPICQNSEPVGTNDITLGASSITATALGVVFYASAAAAASSGQVARAIALQDDANIVVAVDGGASSGSTTPSNVFLKMFDIDGSPQTTFGTSGQQTVLTSYNNQFVNDMVTFTTTADVNKAILAGYVTNSAPSLTGSLLLQYDLDAHALDTTFGGLNGNVSGTTCGDCKQLNCVGLQTNNRIIASGLDQNNNGVLLGYTITGKLDNTFGLGNGYQSVGTGSTGLYTHAIDTLNRIVIAYKNGSAVNLARFLQDGSATDGTSFTAPSGTVVANNQIKVAVDSSNNVYVAAIVASSNSIAVNSYAAAGGAVVNTRTLTGTQLGNASAVYTIARLLVDTSGNVIVVACDSNAKKIVVIRLTSSLVLDTSNFNASAGYLLYQIAAGATSQVAIDAMIHPDGRIMIVGSES